MPLVESDRLLDRFTKLLGKSTHVDIAVAWVGPGLAAESLLQSLERVEARIVVGLSGNATEPATLRRLMAEGNVALRVAPAPPGGLFHPKFYRFGSASRAVCWVGSANFTRGGFGGNAELVHEFGDGKGVGADWFEELWCQLEGDPESAISDYEKRYVPPRPGGWSGGSPIDQRDLQRLEDVETWDEFVAALRELDEFFRQSQFGWDIFGETHSYLHTICVGREVAQRKHWKVWSRRDRDILMGLNLADSGGAWGLLGSMRGAGWAVGTFTPPANAEELAHVHEQVQLVVRADENDIGEAALAAVDGIRQLRGFGAAVATRLLALARPDRLVSVNEPAAGGLGRFAKMTPDRNHLAENYGDLLERFQAKEWYNAPEPADPKEREIWRCRAALADAFVYNPRRN